MSRMIKKPVTIPDKVEVKKDGNLVVAKGPKGELRHEFGDFASIEIKDQEIWVYPNYEKAQRNSDRRRIAMHAGTYWAHIRNMVEGVSKGYEKRLKIVGVGYRAQIQGKKLILNLGYAHPVEIDPPDGITFEVPVATSVVIKGIDKYLVGQVAANIKRWRIPNVYSGKGIRYEGEYIRTKVGKKV